MESVIIYISFLCSSRWTFLSIMHFFKIKTHVNTDLILVSHVETFYIWSCLSDLCDLFLVGWSVFITRELRGAFRGPPPSLPFTFGWCGGLGGPAHCASAPHLPAPCTWCPLWASCCWRKWDFYRGQHMGRCVCHGQLWSIQQEGFLPFCLPAWCWEEPIWSCRAHKDTHFILLVLLVALATADCTDLWIKVLCHSFR